MAHSLFEWERLVSACFLKSRYQSSVVHSIVDLPYFFGYKTNFFSFQNNPKDVDPSYKMDLDLRDCLGRVKIGIIAKFHRSDLVI